MNNELWNTLRQYESIDLVKQHYSDKHGRKLNGEKAYQITCNFSQAREYFKNSTTCNNIVRPLLQYYGALSLSRGLILFLSKTKKEESLVPGHGLEVINWSDILKSKKFEDLKLRLNKGSFYELVTETKNTSLHYANSNRQNWEIFYDVPATKTEIEFLDVIRCIPNLNDDFKNIMGCRLNLVLLNTIQNVESNEYLITARVLGKEEDKDIMSKIFNNSEEIKHLKNNEYEIRTKIFPTFVQKWDSAFKGLGIGDVLITEKRPADFNIISDFYIVSYVFGMLARYYPSHWMKLLNGGDGDKITPFILNFLNLNQKIYPKLVLDFLNKKLD